MRRYPRTVFNGISSGASLTPRVAEQSPWNQITLQRYIALADSTSFSLNRGYIHDVLLAQLGLPATVGAVDVRLQAIQFYDLSARPISAQIHDYNDGDGILKTAVSIPGRNSWARVNLIWPKVVSSMSASFTADSTVQVATGEVGTAVGINTAAFPRLLMRLRLLWKIPSSSTPSLFKVHSLPNKTSHKSNSITKDAPIKREVPEDNSTDFSE